MTKDSQFSIPRLLIPGDLSGSVIQKVTITERGVIVKTNRSYWELQSPNVEVNLVGDPNPSLIGKTIRSYDTKTSVSGYTACQFLLEGGETFTAIWSDSTSCILHVEHKVPLTWGQWWASFWK